MHVQNPLPRPSFLRRQAYGDQNLRSQEKQCMPSPPPSPILPSPRLMMFRNNASFLLFPPRERTLIYIFFNAFPTVNCVWCAAPAEGLLKAGFEPFAKLCVKRVEDINEGRAPAARTTPSPPAAPSAAAAGGGGGGGSTGTSGTSGTAGRARMAAPAAEVRAHACVCS